MFCKLGTSIVVAVMLAIAASGRAAEKSSGAPPAYVPATIPAESETNETAIPTPTSEPEPTAAPASVGKAYERHFDKLVVGDLTFTNVWVNRQTNFNILIRHSGGIYTIKLTDLPKVELEALKPQIGDLANIEIKDNPKIVSRYIELQNSDAVRDRIEEQLQMAGQLVQALLFPVITVMLVIHLLSSFFILAICRKTKTKAGFEVWLPVLNMTSLMRAAGINGVWALLGFVAPLIPVVVFTYQLVPPASFSGFVVVGVSSLFMLASGVVWIVWCFKICVARQKNGWLGILLLLPGVNLLTFLYLAFAD